MLDCLVIGESGRAIAAFGIAGDEPGPPVSLREQLPVDDEPVSVLSGSLGGAVALEVLSTRQCDGGSL